MPQRGRLRPAAGLRLSFFFSQDLVAPGFPRVIVRLEQVGVRLPPGDAVPCLCRAQKYVCLNFATVVTLCVPSIPPGEDIVPERKESPLHLNASMSPRQVELHKRVLYAVRERKKHVIIVLTCL